MVRKKALTFGEALKKQQPVAFSTMVKPIGSMCNLDCNYCYYLDKSELYDKHQPTMNDQLLEEYVRQYIESNDVPLVTFVWHGGEPLIAGVEYYKKALELQKKYADGKQIENCLQTNGVLLDERWCGLFKENNFLIGVSIDGPRDIHDAYRVNKAGEPTFDRVIRGIELMSRMGVEYNTLSVVNNLSEGRGAEVYRFMKSIGSRYMQFLPVVEHVVDVEGSSRPLIVAPGLAANSRLAPWSVSALGYGNFLNDVFDQWIINDVGTYFVQIFDAMLAQWYGAQPGLCAFAETCGDALIVEHNGDVFSCDHFVYPEHKLGNILSDDLRVLLKSTKQFNFGINKRNTLPDECLKCKYYFACKGECPKHRFEVSESGEYNMNTLCAGFKVFMRHIDPYMRQMAALLSEQKPPAYVMPWARQRMGIF